MKRLLPLFLIFALSNCGFQQSSGALHESTGSISSPEQTAETADSICLPDSLAPFKCVIDTLNAAGDPHVSSMYFLYDITGDGNPELWIIQGTCEADKLLWTFTADNNKVRKIYSDYGGHTNFFLNGNTLVSNACNTGAGRISIYRYEKGKIKTKRAKFSSWNEEGKERALRKKDQPIIDFWADYDTEIELNFLKQSDE